MLEIMKFVCVGKIVRNATFHILCPWMVSTTCFALVKISKAEDVERRIHNDLASAYETS